MNYRIFISSTYTDLKEYREVVQKAIRQFGAIDISMEYFGARDERPKDECVRLINEESDLFVGIYAHRYGFVPAGDDTSISETEYQTASELELPRFIYLIEESTPWNPEYIERGGGENKLKQFKGKLTSRHICKFFANKDELAVSVVADVARYIRGQDLVQVNSHDKTAKNTSPSSIGQWNKHRNGVYETNRGYFLVHVLEPSKKEGQEFDILIYLFKHKSNDLSDIKHAEFFLGKHFGNRIIRVENKGGYLGLNVSAYGPFLCICKITFNGGDHIIINRYIDFEAAGTVPPLGFA